MDIDEDDDFYASEEGGKAASIEPKTEVAAPVAKPAPDDELESGEEEDEAGSDDSDSDMEIITERKDGDAAPPPPPQKYNEIRNIPQRSGAAEGTTTKLPVVKRETSQKPRSGSEMPGIATSKIDVNAKPIYEPAGKPITQVNIDEDLNENDKPWRRPGTDVSDYFNYGFDEFTWALYASKQDALRSEYSQEKVALNNKKMMEDLNMMMMGGMPGMMPGAPGGAGMPGADAGMPPEMQAMMQQMMASGMDPSQMGDPSAMFAAMQGGQGGAGGAGAAGFGQGQNQQMGFGYEQAGGGGGGDSRNNRGGNFGRGRGGRRGGGGW